MLHFDYKYEHTYIQIWNIQFQGYKKHLLFQVNMSPMIAEIEQYFTIWLSHMHTHTHTPFILLTISIQKVNLQETESE